MGAVSRFIFFVASEIIERIKPSYTPYSMLMIWDKEERTVECVVEYGT